MFKKGDLEKLKAMGFQAEEKKRKEEVCPVIQQELLKQKVTTNFIKKGQRPREAYQVAEKINKRY